MAMLWQKLGAILLCGNIWAAGTLHLKTRTIDTADLPADYQANSSRSWHAGSSHYLLQYKAAVSAADVEELAARGAVVTGVVPDNAVMVTAGDGFSTEGLDLLYAGRLRGELKVSPLLAGRPDGSAFVVEFHPDVNPLDALEMLRQQNLAVLPHPSLAPNHFVVTGSLQEALALQDWDEVDYIFPASDDLVSGQVVQSCEGALSTSASSTGVGSGQYVVVGHGWPKGTSGAAGIGYFFSALTPNAQQSLVKAEIERAFQAWAKYAPLQFQEKTSATANQTVNVWFASGDHGDGFPFTPSILAHTFYPSNPEPIAGDMHLNLDEAWHTGSNIDIYTVALHEAGHALGLGHSDDPAAIMYPYYRLGAQIMADDIAGIQAIYGAPQAPAADPLTLTIATPALQTTAASLALSGTTASGIGTTVVTWQTDHKASGQAKGSTSWSAAAVPLMPGSNTITLTATDASHRTAIKAVAVTRTVSAPVTAAPAPTSQQVPLSVAISSPAVTILQTNQATIALAGTASASAVKVTWQNGANAGTASGVAVWNATVPLLTGTNPLIVKALDAAGNSSWRSITAVRR